jgi:transglutaminase-like putative cysteine protease
MPKNMNPYRSRWWDWITAFLLVAALFTAALRLSATRWTEDLDIVQTLCILGAVLGFALGVSIFGPLRVTFFTFIYGVIAIPWQLGLTMERGIEWTERLLSIRGRIEIILRELLQREPITDNLLFLLIMSILFWFVSVYSAYTLTRYASAWRVVIPGGLVAFVIHAFDPLLARRTWYLAFYLFFAILLVARVGYIRNRRAWNERRAHIPADAGFDFSRYALLAAMFIVLFAWNVPVMADALQPIAELWRSASRPWLTLKDRASFAFASLRASVGMVSDYYGENLTLSRGNVLTDKIIFEVESPALTYPGLRLYWRSRVYDEYQNNSWRSNFDDLRDVSSSSLDLASPGVDTRAMASFTMFPYEALSNFILVPQPLWISRPGRAHVAYNPDGTLDVSYIESTEFVRPGEQYETRASLSSVTVTELKEAGTDYPDWVTDRYLQLPDNITSRTYELAVQITSGLDNPYDSTNAITQYLRESITYTDFVPQPPTNQERIDWFLFDLRQGFCNYYASAQVIMLRSLGIPSRLAVGYAQGERIGEIINIPTVGPEQPFPEEDLDTTYRYVVRQKDLHAWPEVFFPGIGWVEFEPTASQDELLRPVGNNVPEEENNLELPEPERPDFEDLRNPDINQSDIQTASSDNGRSFWNQVLSYTVIAISISFLGFMVGQVRKGFRIAPFLSTLSIRVPVQIEQGLLRIGVRPPSAIRNWAYYATLPSLSRSYLEVNRALSRLGKKPSPTDTPAERVQSLSNVLPSTAEPAQSLLHEYHQSTYSTHPADLESAHQAGIEIRKLSLIALFQRWLSRFQEPLFPR